MCNAQVGGSRMDERDRQAISDGMRALLQLGETAMRSWDAKHGPGVEGRTPPQFAEPLVPPSKRRAAEVRERHDVGR